MEALLPCYRCGKVPTVDGNGGYPTVSCDACYGGPPDFCASGLNTAQAVADWNERMEMEEPFVECPRNQVGGRHVYAPLDDFCIHCQAKLPRRA